jgi:serine/threonine-protein kinase HipA
MIAESIRAFSLDSSDDARQFFTMLVLSCAMRNGDAHRKNFGVLYEGRGDVRLAPAFDIICTDVYPEIESRMALSLDGSEAWPDAKRLERFGVRHCSLEPESTREIIAKVSEAAIESLALLNDERMPQATGRQMRLSVESGVASMQAAQLRRKSATMEGPRRSDFS